MLSPRYSGLRHELLTDSVEISQLHFILSFNVNQTVTIYFVLISYIGFQFFMHRFGGHSKAVLNPSKHRTLCCSLLVQIKLMNFEKEHILNLR